MSSTSEKKMRFDDVFGLGGDRRQERREQIREEQRGNKREEK
jgi:hypothetical protein